jgi:hypothetical protein
LESGLFQDLSLLIRIDLLFSDKAIQGFSGIISNNRIDFRRGILQKHDG